MNRVQHKRKREKEGEREKANERQRGRERECFKTSARRERSLLARKINMASWTKSQLIWTLKLNNKIIEKEQGHLRQVL